MGALCSWPSSRVRLLPERTRTLVRLCQVLASEGSPPPSTGWQAGDWESVVALAIDRLLAPALWAALARGQVASAIPLPLRNRLSALYRHNVVRNVALRAQLVEAIEKLNGTGIVPVLFKGSLYLLDGTFGNGGERFQWDLDIAVTPQEFAAAQYALEGLGYQARADKPFLHPHELPFVREGELASLEIHTTLGSAPIPSVLPLSLVVADARSLMVGSTRALGLSATHAVVHHILHSQVQDLNHAVAGIPVRQLHTLARVVDAHGPAIDWLIVSQMLGASGMSEVFDASLYQAWALFGVPRPRIAGGNLRARLHHLRALAFWQLGWPTDVLRNLCYAFAPTYLTATYDPSGARGLSALRVQHGCRLIRQRGRALLSEVRTRRV
jgi:hypothetical protein